MAYVTTEVDIDLDCFSDDEILEEYNARFGSDRHIVENGDIAELYEAYVLKKPNFDDLLKNYFYETIGRIA